MRHPHRHAYHALALFALFAAVLFAVFPARAAPTGVVVNDTALYLPLAQRGSTVAMPPPVLAPTPTPAPPSGPIQIILPPGFPSPQHVLGAFFAGCHRDNGNCYFFLIMKIASGNQDGILALLRPGATVVEIVAIIDQGTQFIGPVALGSAMLLPDGSVMISFSACFETPDPPYTGCGPFYWRIMDVDAPFSGARIQGNGRAVEVVQAQ